MTSVTMNKEGKKKRDAEFVISMSETRSDSIRRWTASIGHYRRRISLAMEERLRAEPRQRKAEGESSKESQRLEAMLAMS